MTGQVRMQLRVWLMSDTVFGTGFGLPGGEDISVSVNSAGYPYIKGSSMKGLLREAAKNWLCWSGKDEADLIAMFGQSGYAGRAGERRLQLTSLSLDDPPADPDSCFVDRTFTALAPTGTVLQGSLRVARCIRSGLIFTGTLTCAAQDVELLQRAARCIRTAGVMRSRGLGSIQVGLLPMPAPAPRPDLAPTRCIRYRLRTEEPVIITDLSGSQKNSLETRSLIPGAAVRGMVMTALAQDDPDWVDQNQAALLKEVRFLDALPSAPADQAADQPLPVLPPMRGFYQDKQESCFETVVKTGRCSPGLKQIRPGDACAVRGNTLEFWSVKTDGGTRIHRRLGDDPEMFQTRYLEPGQQLEGCILLKDPALAPRLARAFGEEVWLGADRHEGFGRCTVTTLEPAEDTGLAGAYGFDAAHAPQKTCYLLAMSPFTMLDCLGEPCGLDTALLAELLGVEQVTVLHSSTDMREYGGFNRTWQCRAPALQMYDRGSVFKLQFSQPPALEKLHAIEQAGLGVRTAEGFGQVLFLRPDLFEGITCKHKLDDGPTRSQTAEELAKQRRARCRWIMEQSKTVCGFPLSRSQMGQLQTYCEKAAAAGKETLLTGRLNQIKKEKPYDYINRYKAADEYIQKVLYQPQTLHVPGEDTVENKLSLLIQLIDYARKEGTR